MSQGADLDAPPRDAPLPPHPHLVRLAVVSSPDSLDVAFRLLLVIDPFFVLVRTGP